MKANIKPSNLTAIRSFAEGKTTTLEGCKMQAFYKLIQKKGEPVQAEGNKVNGLKALQITDTEFIAIDRKGYSKNGSFYPCMMQTYLLTII